MKPPSKALQKAIDLKLAARLFRECDRAEARRAARPVTERPKS